MGVELDGAEGLWVDFELEQPARIKLARIKVVRMGMPRRAWPAFASWGRLGKSESTGKTSRAISNVGKQHAEN